MFVLTFQLLQKTICLQFSLFAYFQFLNSIFSCHTNLLHYFSMHSKKLNKTKVLISNNKFLERLFLISIFFSLAYAGSGLAYKNNIT